MEQKRYTPYNRFLTTLCFSLLLSVLSFGQYSDVSRVMIHDNSDHYEMENGYLGVKIPKASQFNPNTPDFVPAPIQSIIFKDGTPSNDFSNYLTSPTPAQTMSVTILQQTTDTCSIKVSYTFNKPELNDGTTIWEPAGPGYYDVTFTMVTGEQVCLVTEESDFEVGYSMKVSDGLSPDKGRYIGHHSTSIANGYDYQNNVYVKGDVTGFNAQVDLTFTDRKDYPRLEKWGPWGINTGWNWQLFDSNGATDANTFGIFHGKPSLLKGVEDSGVNIWTESVTVSDIHSSCDNSGNCHFVWMTEEELWYMNVDKFGVASAEVQVASGLIRPFVFFTGDTVNILAIDPTVTPGSEVKMLTKIGSGAWTTSTLSLDGSLSDPYIYGASNGYDDYIIFRGTRGTDSGILLYHRDNSVTSTFTFTDVLTNGAAYRSSNRPDIKKAPNGDIVIAFSQDNLFQSYNVILDGTNTFSSVPSYPFGQDYTTFGMAVDSRSGDLFFVNTAFINYVDLDGASIDNQYTTGITAFQHNHGGFDIPNRRTIATDENGNALACQNGYLNAQYFFYFDATNNTWSDITTTAWQEIDPSNIHFNTHDDKFYIMGKYQGKLARFSYDHAVGGNPVLETSYSSTERKSAGVTISHNRLPPSQNYSPDIRFQWGIFAGQKDTDIQALNAVQSISLAQNRVVGLAEKVENYQNTPATFNSIFTNGGIYISPTAVQAVIDKVKNDNDFYTHMWQIDASFKVVMDAWRDNTSTTTDQVYQDIVDFSDGLITNLKTGDGIYSFYHLYSLGGNEMRRMATHMSGLMADSKLTTAQRDTLKKKAALFARVIWDDDFVPFQDSTGVGLGTANQYTSFRAYRWFFATLLKDDPEFAARAAAVPTELKEVLEINLNGIGAPIGNSHYLQPAMDVLIFTALQLKNQGIVDEFANNDTLKLFSDFMFFLQTPESVRFSDSRKLICYGDGTEESAGIFGLLGTGYEGVDDELSKKLMYAYRNGPVKGSDFGPVVIAINHELPDDNNLIFETGHFPGYLSNFRSGIGTNDETSMWFLNGDWLSDHRNDDRGAVFMYALNAPLSLQYGSFYEPYIQGGHMKNIVVPQSSFTQWDQSNQPYVLPQSQSWYFSHHEDYFAFENSASSKAYFDNLGTHWFREVHQFHPNTSTPIFVIKDSLNDTSNDYIWNMNFMSDGQVVTPAGNIDPPSGLYDSQNQTGPSPSASTTNTMSGGNLHCFKFTGTNWTAHPTNGIDWELYSAPTTSQDYNLAEWGHTFIPNAESEEFQATNGASFQEQQQILRIKGKEHFYNVIVPFPKGQRPANLAVSKTGYLLTVTCDDFTFNTNLKYYTYNDNEKNILTTFENQSLTFANATIENGPMELEIRTDTIYARLHGQVGSRLVTLPPGNWTLNRLSEHATYDGNTGKWTLTQPTNDTLHNSYRGGFMEFMFVKSVKVSPKIFLQGPYSGGLMNDALRSGGHLPLTEPYTDISSFTHVNSGGGEKTWQAVLDVTGNDAIVDWVFVELRDKTTPAAVVATRAALVQRDGDVVDLDGVSPVDFHSMADDDYYVAVRHRNHLGIRTPFALSLSGSSTSLHDFSTNLSQAWANPSISTNYAMLELGSGVFGMWRGNTNGDNFMNVFDLLQAKFEITPNQAGVYTKGDINLDSNANVFDLLQSKIAITPNKSAHLD